MSVTLRPTSVCDTTPLQRLESQSSSSEPSSPNLTANGNGNGNGVGGCAGAGVGANNGNGSVVVGVTNCGQDPHDIIDDNDNDVDDDDDDVVAALAAQRINHFNLTGGINHLPAVTAPTTATATAAASTIVVNNHNNNKIDVHLSTFVGTTNHTKMDYRSTRRILLRILMDFIILACVGLPIMGFHLYGVPYKRGFFCDDHTLMHPYRDSTVHSWMLYLMGFIMPIALITAVEFFKSNSNKMMQHGFGTLTSASVSASAQAAAITKTRYYFCHMQMPDWMVECYKKIGALIFGAGVCQLTTEIAKYSVGRLRPHFFAVCQPQLFDGSTCDDAVNAGRYIEEFGCTNENISERMLKQLHLSFPSGHANFSCYTMIYIAIYLQTRWTWRRTKMLKHLLQFLCLMFAWYTALTRVSDYKHHWTDVLAGSAIGTIYAIVVTSSMW